MRAEKAKRPDHHYVSLEGKREALHLARSIGPWRFSAAKLVVAAWTGGADGLTIEVDTVNLTDLHAKLRPPCPELDHYMGSLSMQTAGVITEVLPTINTTGSLSVSGEVKDCSLLQQPA